MSNRPIKVRASLKGGVTVIKALMYHPMETGLRKDKKSGQTIPAHFIQEITCKHNGETKLRFQTGVSVSKNPFLQFELEGGAKDDEIEITWQDNKGAQQSTTTTIK